MTKSGWKNNFNIFKRFVGENALQTV